MHSPERLAPQLQHSDRQCLNPRSRFSWARNCHWREMFGTNCTVLCEKCYHYSKIQGRGILTYSYPEILHCGRQRSLLLQTSRKEGLPALDVLAYTEAPATLARAFVLSNMAALRFLKLNVLLLIKVLPSCLTLQQGWRRGDYNDMRWRPAYVSGGKLPTRSLVLSTDSFGKSGVSRLINVAMATRNGCGIRPAAAEVEDFKRAPLGPTLQIITVEQDLQNAAQCTAPFQS